MHLYRLIAFEAVHTSRLSLHRQAIVGVVIKNVLYHVDFLFV